MLFFVRNYLQAKLGQRGAEMVEYAIVIACIAAVGVALYTNGKGTSTTLGGILKVLFAKALTTVVPNYDGQ